MIGIRFVGDGDGCWPDLAPLLQDGRLIHLGNDAPMIQVSGLRGGMASGKPSVSLRLDLPDGRVVLAETSLALWLTVSDGLKAMFGDPREGTP